MSSALISPHQGMVSSVPIVCERGRQNEVMTAASVSRGLRSMSQGASEVAIETEEEAGAGGAPAQWVCRTVLGKREEPPLL